MMRGTSLVSLGISLSMVIAFAPAAHAQDEGDPAADGAADGAEGGSTEAGTEDSPLVKKADKRRWGVGARLRYVFVPAGVTELFVDHATSMNSVGIGAEVITRKGNFDVVFGLEYENIEAENGLYLAKGDEVTDQFDGPDLVEFDGFALLGLDASFIWHAKIGEKIQLRYGAGIGIGIVLGDILQTDYRCDTGTVISDLDDASTAQCSPMTGGKVKVKSEDVPPVVPIVNVLLGARFMLSDEVALNVETGFRDMFYVGVGAGYVF
jgi:hypothetical protein